MESLEFKPIEEANDLVSNSVLQFSKQFPEALKPLVAEISPEFMGGKELCEHYGIDPRDGANCVIVEAVKGDTKNCVAIVVPVGYRADLNGFVRKHLDVKRVSLAPLEEVIEKTGMEYGSITPFGLPESWKILIDSRIMNKEKIICGGGKQKSKLFVQTKVFGQMKNVDVIDELSKPMLISS